MIKKFIKSVRDEKDGFSFDQPWRLEEKSLGVVIPILRKSKEKREYITLSEASDVKIEDTGQIDYVYVKNNEDKPVLISRGEIFRGKTQERAAIHDHIVMPKSGLRVCVRCVHQSKGINLSADMKSQGRTPYDVNLSNQGDAWSDIQVYAVNAHNAQVQYSASVVGMAAGAGPTFDSNLGIGTPSPDMPISDDLVSTIDSMSSSLKEVFKKIPFIKNQVGAAFFKEHTLIGMDVYDLPDSWDAVKKDVVEKEGSAFIEKDDAEMFQFKPEAAKKLIQKKLSADFEEKTIYDREYKVIELRGENLLGEAVEFKGKIIHLTLWNN